MRLIEVGEQLSSTKSSVSQGSRENSAKMTRIRQLEFNERLKKAIVRTTAAQPQNPVRRKKNHDMSPMRCAGTNKLLMKVVLCNRDSKDEAVPR